MTSRLGALLLCLAWPHLGAGEDGAALLQAQAETRGFTETLLAAFTRAANGTWRSGLEDAEWYALARDANNTKEMYEALAEQMTHSDFPHLTFGGVRRMINAVPGLYVPDPDPPIPGFWQIGVLDFQKLRGMLVSTADYRRRYWDRWSTCMENAEKDFNEAMNSIEGHAPNNPKSFVKWTQFVMSRVEEIWTSFHQFALDEQVRYQPIWREILARTDTIPATMMDDFMKNYEENSKGAPFCWARVFNNENMHLKRCLELLSEFQTRASRYMAAGQAWLPMSRTFDNYVPTMVRLTAFSLSNQVKSEYIKATHEADEFGRRQIAIEKRILDRAIEALNGHSRRLGLKIENGVVAQTP